MRMIRDIKRDIQDCEARMARIMGKGSSLEMNTDGTITTIQDLGLCRDSLKTELITTLEGIQSELMSKLGKVA